MVPEAVLEWCSLKISWGSMPSDCPSFSTVHISALLQISPLDEESFITPNAHAQQGVKCDRVCLLSVCPSVGKKILRWRELVTSILIISEALKTLQSYLPVPASGLIRSHLLGFQLFSYYPVHFVSHFIYGHRSHPQSMSHIHAHTNQLVNQSS